MPKWSKHYGINNNASIHLVRLTDNPDSSTDNLMTTIFRLKLNNLAPFEKTRKTPGDSEKALGLTCVRRHK